MFILKMKPKASLHRVLFVVVTFCPRILHVPCVSAVSSRAACLTSNMFANLSNLGEDENPSPKPLALGLGSVDHTDPRAAVSYWEAGLFPCSQSVLSSAVLKTLREGLSRERNKCSHATSFLHSSALLCCFKVFWVLWIAWVCEMKGLCS